ncbi:MAG: methyl-accepting chemotaxis protein [Undibacterium sp.]|uniref:methyl-accepting chemotaxis protein n=1 Tax=Undibacterium sp. TaxID=1914977 RepID=UPI00271F121A|nr:methyl-accepting chemotaxis protein [Undibacterium sp.]MDO8652214.1 methyl-accepting chemotaxis protein [Undibacterium sp.]
MAYSRMVLRASAQLLSLCRNLALVRSRQLVVAATLVVIGVCRLLPATYLQGVDRLIGRPGDAVLLLAVLLLTMLLWVSNKLVHRSLPSLPSIRPFEPAAAILENHLRLDQEIDNKLGEVIGDTESSALAIIGQVRQLYDTASTLVAYLDNSSLKAGDLGREIIDSVAYLVEIGTFIQHLPAKMEHDLQSVQIVVAEIKELGGLVEAVQVISMQSHLLAINAAIEASRAGPSGAAFRIVADEVRSLASNTNTVAARIKEGLSRARLAVEGGMASNIEQSSQRLDEVSHAVVTIQKLRDNFEDMSQYYKTRFAVVTKHNGDLAKDIAEVLGQIQYQDVVRQCIERIRFAIGQRNAFFQNAVSMADQDGADLAQLPQLLELILNDYLTEEEKHMHSARHGSDSSSELKIELF